jgi:hypothetical protein
MTIQFTVSRDSFALPLLTDRSTRLYDNVKKLITGLFQFVQSASGVSGGFSDSARTSQFRRQFKKNKFFFIPVGIIVLLLLFGIFYAVSKANSGNSGIAGTSDSRVELKPAIASQSLNKTYNFPLKDNAGKEVSKIQFSLEKAELRDEIIVKGQRATSVKGRTFLILPVKITNSFNQAVEINARDYIRLTINNSSEKLAPDIHNDPVEVQAISTKQTRVGFPIDDTATNLILQIGEINGSKENIKLELKK